MSLPSCVHTQAWAQTMGCIGRIFCGPFQRGTYVRKHYEQWGCMIKRLSKYESKKTEGAEMVSG
jgi:hypothetical protein